MRLRDHLPPTAKATARHYVDRCRQTGAYFAIEKVVNRRKIQTAPRPYKLNLGCGPKLLRGWLNIDCRKTDPSVAVMRLPHGLRALPDQSASFTYASHSIQYLEYPGDAYELCRQVFRILQPGGAFRIVTPGIEQAIRAYVSRDAAFWENQKNNHQPWCTTPMEHINEAMRGHSNTRYGYDFETAEKMLREVGFQTVVRSDYQASKFPELRVDFRGEGTSLFVDAVRER
jgi:predicted SAM-dependent methyltransferase